MTARFTLLRAFLDRAHPARREYERFRATPEEAAEAVQAARAKLDATVQAEAKPGENPAGQCGPECAEQQPSGPSGLTNARHPSLTTGAAAAPQASPPWPWRTGPGADAC